MNYSKEESIVAQVAAKIAAEMIVASGASSPSAQWEEAYEFVRDKLFEDHGFQSGGFIPQSQPRQQTAPYQDAGQAQYAIDTAMPGATEVTHSLRVKGDMHGPLPDWLFGAAADAGVTEVWDNRDQLAANPKRPWFRSTSGGENAAAFWPPKAGGRR